MREYDFADARPRRRRYDDEYDEYDDQLTGVRQRRQSRAEPNDDPGDADRAGADPDAGAAAGGHWSTWADPGVVHGPEPTPAWVVTELAATDHDLGVIKTGKEADVHLVERAVPGTDRSCLLAAKRYRAPEHRLFHRDAGYLEGRRVRRSRENRAMARRSGFGREMIAGQWAFAEFTALGHLWRLGEKSGLVSVPYPVQLLGSELLLEYVAQPDGSPAPRLAQLRPGLDELGELWRQLYQALAALARSGLAHGDLSPYNILVRDGRPVLIDLPQVVDVVANPQGPRLLARDVSVVAAWFGGRGLPIDADTVTAELLADAGAR